MNLDKPKSKITESNLPEWLEPFIGPLYVDFIAPFPLETALKIIKRQEIGGFFRYRKISISLTPDDADTYDFHLKKWGNKYATTEAHGFFKRWSKNSTLVKAQVNVALGYYLLYAVMTVFFVLFSMFMFTRISYFGLIFFGIMILNWYFVRRNRHDVANLIENSLLADLKDDDLYTDEL